MVVMIYTDEIIIPRGKSNGTLNQRNDPSIDLDLSELVVVWIWTRRNKIKRRRATI